MQTPPPFHGYESQPMPPQKPKTSAVVIIFAVLGVLLICCGLPIGIGGFYGFKGFKGAMAIGGCMANVDGMKRALHSYTAAHDGKLPSAKTWQTDLGEYLVANKEMDDSPLKMWKAGGEWACEEGGNKTGFMFNEALSEKKVADVTKNLPDAIAIFETKTVSFNQSGPFKALPHSESPKIFGEFTDKRRGWLLLKPEGDQIYTRNESGKLVRFSSDFDMDEKSTGSKNFKVKVNTSSGPSDEKDSTDSKDSKDDNSN